MNLIEQFKEEIKEVQPVERLKVFMSLHNLNTDFDTIDLDNPYIKEFVDNSIKVLKEIYLYEDYDFNKELESFKKLGKIRKYKPSNLLNEIIAESYGWTFEESHTYEIVNIYVNRTNEDIIQDINILIEFRNGRSTTITLDREFSKYLSSHRRIKNDTIELTIINELCVSKYKYAYFYDIVPQNFDSYDIYDTLTILQAISYDDY